MTSSHDGYDWTKWRYAGLSVWAQNVRVYQNQLVMVWSSLHDSNIWYVTSTDGLKWEIVGKTEAIPQRPLQYDDQRARQPTNDLGLY
jgi:hypothetical protein